MARALTIFVRHELAPANRRLLDALGATVVVSPDAPSCAFTGGAKGRWGKCLRCAALDRQLERRARAVADELHGRARAAGRQRRA